MIQTRSLHHSPSPASLAPHPPTPLVFLGHGEPTCLSLHMPRSVTGRKLKKVACLLLLAVVTHSPPDGSAVIRHFCFIIRMSLSNTADSATIPLKTLAWRTEARLPPLHQTPLPLQGGSYLEISLLYKILLCYVCVCL